MQSKRVGMLQNIQKSLLHRLGGGQGGVADAEIEHVFFADPGGKSITVCGWARTIRDSKALGFIDLNDGSCFKGVQVVFEADKINN